MTSRLKNSIKNLYDVFEKYHGNLNMSGSSNYDNLDKWNKKLFSKSLRDLDEDDLSLYVGKAITTWGEKNDYKHFLPRILELTAEYRTPYEIWIAFDKLAISDWNNWLEDEQRAIQEFMIALWENILNDNSEKAEYEFQDYFSSLANFYPNFSELLDIWTGVKSKSGIKHFSEMLINEQVMIFDKKKISGFYDKTENIEEFISWVLSDKMLNKVEEDYFKFETESFAPKVSWAEQIITNRRRI